MDRLPLPSPSYVPTPPPPYIRRLTAALVAALLAVGSLAVAVAPASAQPAHELTVTPEAVERPESGQRDVTLTFSHGCAGCWVELDPGWTNPAADQAVKGKSADFRAANYWATDVTINGKRGKGPVPAALGIKVRPGDGDDRFIRFTLNDSTGVVAEAQVWLSPPLLPDQQPQANEPHQGPSGDSGPQGESDVQGEAGGNGIACTISMKEGEYQPDSYYRIPYQVFTRSYAGEHHNSPDRWPPWTVTDLIREVYPGEAVTFNFSVYRSSDFDFRLHIHSVVNLVTGKTISLPGLRTDVKWGSSSHVNAPSNDFQVNYSIVGGGVSNVCSIRVAVGYDRYTP